MVLVRTVEITVAVYVAAIAMTVAIAVAIAIVVIVAAAVVMVAVTVEAVVIVRSNETLLIVKDPKDTKWHFGTGIGACKIKNFFWNSFTVKMCQFFN